MTLKVTVGVALFFAICSVQASDTRYTRYLRKLNYKYVA